MTKTMILPTLGLVAMQHKQGAGAWRLWVLSRYLDKSGSEPRGYVHTDALQRSASRYGVSRRSFYNWMKAARQYGLLRYNNTKTRVIYTSEQKIRAFGPIPQDKHHAEVSIKKLMSKGWKATLWAGLVKANFDGQQISRRTLEDLTGITSRHQRQIDGKVTRKKNIAVTKHDGGKVGIYRDMASRAGQRAAFVFRDKDGRQKTAYHISATVSVSDNIAKTGSTPKSFFAARPNSRYYPPISRRALSEKSWQVYFPVKMADRVRARAARVAHLAEPEFLYLARKHRSRTQVHDEIPRLLPSPVIVQKTVIVNVPPLGEAV